ncbi:mobilization protein MobC [Photorhabdus sp. RM71S]|uniref:mobilization protein MobC n=1 Tax=Photorhabdus sp. RM71S TaxID=3342824 RepID=UPI0036DC3649
MAANTFYTKEQIKIAKLQLEELPDLTETRLTGKDVLENLKTQIFELATKKGYSVKDIKSALGTCKINVSERAIKDVLNSPKGNKKKIIRRLSTQDKTPQKPDKVSQD